MPLVPPVRVLKLFPLERARFIDLLQDLLRSHWAAPTSCPGWSVKDIVAHVLGDDFGSLSGGRDGHTAFWFTGDEWDELVAYINRQNEAWVAAMRRLSPDLLIELLVYTGTRTQIYFEGLDMSAAGPTVSWAGPGPHPIWLHVAREYTERWLHQMQVREAVGASGLYDRALFQPVLATFVHALPVALRDTPAPPGTRVEVLVRGEAGDVWTVVCGHGGWALHPGGSSSAAARVTLDQVTAWKLWTKGVSPEKARDRVTFEGDQGLGERVLRAVAIIA
jgi:uncharacterized protein (TIGR03083 family)